MNYLLLGVCQTDQSKGIFRRRPSSASQRSSRANSLKPPSNGAQSCPSSPKHMQRKSIRTDSMTNSTSFQIPEDDVLDVTYMSSSSGPSSLPEQSIRTRDRELEEQKERQKQEEQQKLQQQQQKQLQQLQQRQQRQQQQHQPQSPQLQYEQPNQRDRQKQQEQQDQNYFGLYRSASTISSSSFRPRSSPSGLYSYTGRTSASSTPSSVHGSRADITKDERGSAIYLGCNAPRNNDSSWSISSSRSSGSCSQPATPIQTPPVSPRKASSARRSSSLVKKNR